MGAVTTKILGGVGSIFGLKKPKTAAPPKIPPPPAPAPTPTDPNVLAARAQQRAAGANLNQQTILTSPLGLTTPAFTTGTKTLLGQ